MYTSASESEERGVINVGQARVETSTEVEKLLQRKDVFALYTAVNCYFLQAESHALMSQWFAVCSDAYWVDFCSKFDNLWTGSRPVSIYPVYVRYTAPHY